MYPFPAGCPTISGPVGLSVALLTAVKKPYALLRSPDPSRGTDGLSCPSLSSVVLPFTAFLGTMEA